MNRVDIKITELTHMIGVPPYPRWKRLEFTYNGFYHREDGPALIDVKGYQEHRILTKEDFA